MKSSQHSWQSNRYSERQTPGPRALWSRNARDSHPSHFANTEVQSLEIHAWEFQQHRPVQQAVEAGPVLGQYVLDPLAKRIPADTPAKKEVAKRN